jgi:hypothetical protein
VAVYPNTRSTSISGPIPLSNIARNNHITASNSQHVAIPENPNMNGGGHSPTLPPLSTQPTLNALINSSLGESGAGPAALNDPAIVSSSLLYQPPQSSESLSGPRIGDPGKRMLGAALGVRHPGLGHRMANGGSGQQQQHMSSGTDHTMRDMQRAMGGLVVAE